jgi:crotonobetainyl-CoA:carnitine CoA-transferase CaiB-like acyl-CoA transferase
MKSNDDTPRKGDETASGPLDGIRVVDLSRLVAGNQLTMLLADFGAEVIKIEQPGQGDPLRHWRIGGEPLHWEVYGRNKKSVTLDLKSSEGRESLLRLAADADVLVESFRPGTLEKLGLAPDTLHKHNSRLLVVRISGWGQTGDFAGRPGFGTLVEAMSGFAAMNGFEDREPVLPPNSLADMVAGTYGAFAVAAALRRSEGREGTGQIMDLSLFEPLFSILGPVAAAYETTGEVKKRVGSRSQTAAPRNVYKTKDGKWLALSSSTQPMTERFFRTIGHPELIDDPRFANNSARLQHVDELDVVLNGYFSARTADEILKTMSDAGVTMAPVMGIDELLESALFRSRDVVVHGPRHKDGSTVLMHNVVPRLSRTPGSLRTPAPELGEHNEQYLG